MPPETQATTKRRLHRIDACADALVRFLDAHPRTAVLTGAGCSTASGIPEYRDDAGEWKHAQPVQFADYTGSEAVRRRYWARSFTGWRRISTAQPNAAHRALATLGDSACAGGIVTQNVDDLHRRAGSRDVIDLHGVLARVRCLGCQAVEDRPGFQSRLEQLNPGWTAVGGAIRPDGDAELGDVALDGFNVPACEACGGIVKPDVVFFGEQVPAARVARARDRVATADALLVVGSSLMVFSGFRFVRQAVQAGQPVAILNRGRTRADDVAALRLHADCGDVLSAACARLGAPA